jgi:hypothetical protein
LIGFFSLYLGRDYEAIDKVQEFSTLATSQAEKGKTKTLEIQCSLGDILLEPVLKKIVDRSKNFQIMKIL